MQRSTTRGSLSSHLDRMNNGSPSSPTHSRAAQIARPNTAPTELGASRALDPISRSPQKAYKDAEKLARDCKSTGWTDSLALSSLGKLLAPIDDQKRGQQLPIIHRASVGPSILQSRLSNGSGKGERSGQDYYRVRFCEDVKPHDGTYLPQSKRRELVRPASTPQPRAALSSNVMTPFNADNESNAFAIYDSMVAIDPGVPRRGRHSQTSQETQTPE
ncbi:hypothetical protein BKA62DRAFT_697180 [Auriculariales sp. MPI-PUGE-AT-0066]|nr:hypothetical protein BKA62DRAFT_697180 [Auriculariales sp. MPI-PUGE-AT-0066]